MSRKKIKISKKQIFDLYWKNNLSPYKIGDVLNCSFSTITNRMKEYSIPRKSDSAARNRYKKEDFSGSNTDRAYMLGFRLGDLNVYQTNVNSEVIVVRCHTTSRNQVDVMKRMFSNYGKVTASYSIKNQYNINCFLNRSFQFLLDKNDSYKNLLSKEERFAFIAGYFDAEGYLGLNQNKARLKIDSYDNEILKWISSTLSKYQIRNKLNLISECKTKRSFGKQLMRLNINYADDLLKFIFEIEQFCLHAIKLSQIKIAKRNIISRQKSTRSVS